MKIIYSNHAKKRMKRREVEEWEVKHVLDFPSYTKKSFDGKIEAVGTIKNKTLKVVFVKSENYIKIITVILK
ncbi:MAG: DUF4258 domain-containing protein [Nanoarchaeota archaeon]